MSKKYVLISAILMWGIALFSCKREKGKDDICKTVAEWQGREIVFPDGLVFTRLGKDTVTSLLPASGYKVLSYTDSLGCTGCKLQLSKWKEFIAQTDSLTGNTVPFLFFFHPKDSRELHYMLKRDGFDAAVCLDLDDRLNRHNRFPSNIAFQTFLLDGANRVVVIGNPVHNSEVKELYLKQFNGEKKPAAANTSAEVEPEAADLGDFPKGEKRRAVFTIRNTGSEPLIITGTAVSCECISATCDKHPAAPGGTLPVTVEANPEVTGVFEEVITVKCNCERMIKLVVRGNVL
ncbi:MAG: DUF1573 domain-containing protein [Tannerella sp.]|nr:DUF1573 domain-containing protein [Tannerella sp.]